MRKKQSLNTENQVTPVDAFGEDEKNYNQKENSEVYILFPFLDI